MMLRRFPPVWAAGFLCLLYAAFGLLGEGNAAVCGGTTEPPPTNTTTPETNTTTPETNTTTPETNTTTPETNTTTPETNTTVTLFFGAFNGKTVGKAKMSNNELAQHIKTIVERYDVLLLQEIRNKDLVYVWQLLNMLDPPFAFVISEPIGRTTYKEQYAYFYRTDRVLLLDSYKYADNDDDFEREPLIAKFAPISSNASKVSLIGLHAKPTDAVAEIGHLEEVIADVLVRMGNDSEPIILGDLNAACTYANYNDRVAADDYLTDNPDYIWLIEEYADTTVKASTDCSYDRIIIPSSFEDHVANGSVAVYDFGVAFGLSEAEAYAVSDHFPVEVKFILDL